MPTHTGIAAIRVGEIEAIKVPTETPRNGEVLIKVKYSSLFPFDTYIVDLGYFVTEFPTILGFNASGTVAQLGDGVTDLAVGDRVGTFSTSSPNCPESNNWQRSLRSLTLAHVPKGCNNTRSNRAQWLPR